MSDYDYERENGLWGELRTSISYNRSEQRALANGFKEVADDKAYNGRYFIKDNLLWIHNISALKSKLHITDNSELVQRGYDVEAYFHAA